MSPFETLQPEGWPRPKGYANGVRIPAGHDLVLTAGVVGWDVDERIVPGGFVAQFDQALANILAVVECAGGGPANVAQMTVYVTDREAYLESLGDLGAVWRARMGRNFPAMALVQVAGLVEEGALLEIEAVAAIAPSA